LKVSRSCKSAAIRFFFWLTLLLAAFSCTYKNSDEYFRDVPRPVDPEITVSNLAGHDTVVTAGFFQVQVSCQSMTMCRLEVVSGSVTKFSQTSKYGSFNVNAAAIGPSAGIYSCTLHVYYQVSTGSLASVLGKETFQVQKEIILIYTPDPVHFDPEVTFSALGGTLTGRLELQVTNPLVSRIKVEKSVGASVQYFYLTTVDGSSPFVFPDSGYVGERADYRITTFFSNPQGTWYFPYSIGETYKEAEMQPVTITTAADGYLQLNWQPTNYPANCGGYRIFNYYTKSFHELDTVPEPGPAGYEVTGIAFPGDNKVYVSMLPKRPPPYYDQSLAIAEYSAFANASAGIGSMVFDYFFSPVGPDFFTRYARQATGYSVNTLQVTHQLPKVQEMYSMCVSPNSQYLLTFTFNAGAFRYQLYHIPTKTLQDVLANTVDPGLNIMQALSISDNGVAVVGPPYGDVIVYDFVNHRRIGRVQYLDCQETEISPDGKYFFIKEGRLFFYRIDGDVITELWHSQHGEGYYLWFSFLPSDPGKAVIIQDQACTIRKCSDWSVVRSFPVNFNAFENSDFNTGRIMGRDGDLYDQLYQVVDFNTGSVLKQFNSNTFMNPYVKINGSNLLYGEGKRVVIF
jgi:hypothetical protein